jgi:drug/metabolite transporter (DMT)-like permease
MTGLAYGAVAFFSVFLFMFKGRTATFAGLSNRLTSLVAGTIATLLFAVIFSGKFPKKEDWISLMFIFIAVFFLARSEKKRTFELKTAKELA